MMSEKLLNDLERQSEVLGVRVVLIAAFQAGKLLAYTECLSDVSGLLNKPKGTITSFLDGAPERVAELTGMDS